MRTRAVLLAAIGLLLAGNAAALLAVDGAPGSSLLAPPPAEAVATAVSPTAVNAAVTDPEAPPPRRVTIERLGIDSTLVNLRVQTDGALEVPSDFDVAGWHRAGTAPGDVGPAVLVGHVDSYEGPAVFYRLPELQAGDRVTVTRADGSHVVFEVYGLETVPKDQFPTDRVYGPTDGPELRLLTCGGAFDEDSRSYQDNVIAYARLVPEAATS